MRAYATRPAVEAMLVHGPIRSSWIVDDPGFVKQSKLSPGVQRHYTGGAGKTTNCQIGVSLVIATDKAHVAADFQLYIPESWASDRQRCRRAYISDDVEYAPKWCLALGMIERAVAQGLPQDIVLADCDYGNKTAFRDALDTMGLQYAVEMQSATMVSSCVGNTGRLSDRMSLGALGAAALRSKLRTVMWRQGTKAHDALAVRAPARVGRSRRRPDESTTVIARRVG